jgi:hypothetical protein
LVRTDVSEERIASICKHLITILSSRFTCPDDGGDTFLRNVGSNQKYTSRSQKTVSCTVKKFIAFLQSLKVQYHAHKNQELVSTLSQMKPASSFFFIISSFWIYFNGTVPSTPMYRDTVCSGNLGRVGDGNNEYYLNVRWKLKGEF